MDSEFARTPEVQDWQWQIATMMRQGLESSFGSRPDEVDCVRALVEAIGKTAPVTSRVRARDALKLEVESAFIESAFLHGSQSQVKFQVGGSSYQRELADLLVIASFVEDGRFSFQRACFIQAKRSGAPSGSAAARFGIDPWQLVLLSSFPEFTGLAGELKGATMHLRNRSGMLGAYGFISPPGEFTVVSARILNHLLGGRKSFPAKELVPAILSEAGASRSASPIRSDREWLRELDPDHCPYCHEIVMLHGHPHRWWRHHHGPAGGHAPAPEAPAESVLTCVGLDEFVQSWSGLRLGEVWHPGMPTNSDRTLQRCLSRILKRVARKTGTLSRVNRMLAEAGGGNDDDRVQNGAGDDESPGLGILSVIGTLTHGQDQEG